MVISSMHPPADYETAMTARQMRLRLRITGDAQERRERIEWRRQSCREALAVLKATPPPRAS